MTLRSLDVSSLKHQDITVLYQAEKNVKNNGDSNFEYFYIGNIPSTYKSADLRWFFKDFVENCAFKCFHYRHRPERQVVVNKEEDLDVQSKNKDNLTCGCIVTVFNEFTERFVKEYNSKEWRNKELQFLKRTTVIRKINIKTKPSTEENYLTNGIMKAGKHIASQDLYLEDLNSSIELNPPVFVMPNGNVGTTTKHFLKLIKECKMPSSLIKSLSIEFPKKRDQIYRNVPPNYGENNANTNDIHDYVENNALTNDIHNYEENTSRGISDKKYSGKSDSHNGLCGHFEEENEAEDWERYNALHDNVDNQSRPKERLFEEDIELKWEKGGSGLVFYTDAYYWNEMKGKDFDEDTVDDWDVDYSVYYEDGAGDKPARDQLKMRIEQRRRDGKEDGPTKPSHLCRKEKHGVNHMKANFAAFEKHNKGFGSRILKNQGWIEGCGVGTTSQGITEPLDPYGQKPYHRLGLGYFGEKIDRSQTLKRKAEKDVYISTKYDVKDEEHENAMRFNGLDLLKYRDSSQNFVSRENK